MDDSCYQCAHFPEECGGTEGCLPKRASEAQVTEADILPIYKFVNGCMYPVDFAKMYAHRYDGFIKQKKLPPEASLP